MTENFSSEIINDILLMTQEKLPSHLLSRKFSHMEGTNFYYGLGKTGSTSIVNGLISNNFHLHSIMNIDPFCNKIFSSNNINVYDLIKIYGKTYNYKPLIIECFREPVSLYISLLFEFELSRFNSMHPFCVSIPKKLKEEYYITNNTNEKILIISKMLKFLLKKYKSTIMGLANYDYFKKNENFDIIENLNKKDYLYHSFENYKLLILKFENIKNFKKIFHECGYEYKNTHANKKNGEDSEAIKKNPKLLNLTNDILELIYNSDNVKNLYSNEEIKKFKEKYLCKYD